MLFAINAVFIEFDFQLIGEKLFEISWLFGSARFEEFCVII